MLFTCSTFHRSCLLKHEWSCPWDKLLSSPYDFVFISQPRRWERDYHVRRSAEVTFTALAHIRCLWAEYQQLISDLFYHSLSWTQRFLLKVSALEFVFYELLMLQCLIWKQWSLPRSRCSLLNTATDLPKLWYLHSAYVHLLRAVVKPNGSISCYLIHQLHLT